MVFWIITPLQSAIFNTGIAIRSTPVQMRYSAALPHIDQQTTKLNINFLNTAYGVAWLHQRLPAFTTMDYAAIPFRPTTETSLTSSSLETWTGSVETYGTSLNCTPAIVTQQILYYTFDNGRGCVVPQIGLPQTHNDSQFLVQYLSYYADAHVDSFLANPNCSVEHSDNFLAIWATNTSAGQPGIYSNMTALFCVPSYHTQSVTVTVNASNGAIIDPINDHIGSRVDLPQGVLNTTQFEYVIGGKFLSLQTHLYYPCPLTSRLPAGLSSTTERKNHEDSVTIEQYPQLKDFGLTWPVSNAVGFAVGLGGVPTEELSNHSTLHQAFEKAHRILFSAAFSTLLAPSSNDTQTAWQGIRHDRPGAIILVRPIAIVVEAVLGVIALLTISLWYLSYRRKSNLPFDPASIADVVSILPQDTKLARCLEKDSASLESLNTKQTKYQLVRNGNSMELISVPLTTMGEATEGIQVQKGSRMATEKKELFVRPRELRAWVGAGLLGVILGSVSIIIFFLLKSSKNNGTQRAIPVSTNVANSCRNYSPLFESDSSVDFGELSPNHVRYIFGTSLGHS
jgi:hypothetical protein